MFKLTDQPISEHLKRELANTAAGALVSFEGWVRDHNEGKKVLRLEYESYRELAEKEADKILQEARERFAILDAFCVHRTGLLELGEIAVWVGVCAAHRPAAFAACRYIIDEIKLRLPIWKKEHYVDGVAEWVNCHGCQHAQTEHHQP